MYRKEIRAGSRAIAWWGGTAVAVVLAATTALVIVRPWWADQNTREVEHSYTYVQTKRELLVHLVQDYRHAEAEQALHKDDPQVVASLEAEKRGIALRIRSEASSLPIDQVPDEAKPFLGGST